MPDAVMDANALDNPVYAALTGPHAAFAERIGERVLRYPVDVTPFLAAPADMSPADWRAAAAVAPEGTFAGVIGEPGTERPGWRTLRAFEVVQMTEVSASGTAEPDAVPLGAADVAEILQLITLTEPGPFLERTIELGVYLGIRRDGTLVAMAGERLHLDGWTEISAVCTHPDARGEGLATRLIGAIVAGVQARGERVFLHAVPTNPAIALYEALGFTIRRTLSIALITPE